MNLGRHPSWKVTRQEPAPSVTRTCRSLWPESGRIGLVAATIRQGRGRARELRRDDVVEHRDRLARRAVGRQRPNISELAEFETSYRRDRSDVSNRRDGRSRPTDATTRICTPPQSPRVPQRRSLPAYAAAKSAVSLFGSVSNWIQLMAREQLLAHCLAARAEARRVLDVAGRGHVRSTDLAVVPPGAGLLLEAPGDPAGGLRVEGVVRRAREAGEVGACARGAEASFVDGWLRPRSWTRPIVPDHVDSSAAVA